MAASFQGPAPPNRYHFPTTPVANPRAVVKGSRGKCHWRFTLLSAVVVRYEWSPDGAFEDRASTFATNRNFRAPPFTQHMTNRHLFINTEAFIIMYDRSKFSPEGLRIQARDRAWVWKYDGKSYGDLGGTARTLDGIDGRVDLPPGLASRKRPYSVLDDSNSMLINANGWIGTRKPGCIDGYFFCFGTRYAAAIKWMYRISGPPPLLPRWALGNWWSRYHAYSDREYLQLMDKFLRHGVPLTAAVIDMDWHLVDIPAEHGTGWTGYTWNKDLFPCPEEFLAHLHKHGLRVALNDHPADGVRSFEELYKDVAEALHRDTSQGEAIEFDCCDREFMDAYFDVLKAKIEAQGVDFWWVDWQQGSKSRWPGVDPLWVLNHYHYLASKRNAGQLEQPMILSRYAGPGSHRYPIGFSGDSIISWESLHFQPEFTATASNIGYGWWSHDIGGHYGGVRCSELAARWVQLGCFSPIMRLHSSEGPWISKEPWNFDVPTRRIMESFMRFRHSMIPYLYTMNVRATYDLEPLIQPLYWKHANKPAYCYNFPNEFYFGPSLLVAPITQPTSPCTRRAAVPVWLPGPAARYVDIFNPSLVYSARDCPLILHRVLDEIPVLAPEGTILVLDGTCLPTPTGVTLPSSSHGVSRPAEIEIWLVVGASGFFTLYEEPLSSNTVAANPPRQALSAIPITWEQASGTLTIGPAHNPHPENTNRIWRVRLVGCCHPLHPDGFIDLGTEPSLAIVTPGRSFPVLLGPGLVLDKVDVQERIKEVIMLAEIPHMQKDPILELVMDKTRPVGERVRHLWAMKRVDKALKAAVMEVWVSDGRSQGNAVGWEMWDVVEEEGDDSSSDGEEEDEDTLYDAGYECMSLDEQEDEEDECMGEANEEEEKVEGDEKVYLVDEAVETIETDEAVGAVEGGVESL